ncbi:MAG: outer membrane beta-barrel protein [Candidatus Binataceae bacterium]
MASPNAIDLSTIPGLANIPYLADLGKFDVNAVASGVGIVQDHATASDRSARADISNAFVILQKADGVVQFYLQVGAYDSLALGTPYVSTGKAVSDLYGPMPVAYLKIAPTDNFSIEAGNLPTLIGAEYTFTFENINVERGLLWNQENAINRGVQLNYTNGPITAALSWNNGFYSNSYTWVWGSLSYAFNAANTLTAVGGGNAGFDRHSSFVAPALLNNSQIYNLIYTYTSAPWIIQPYFQWTYVPQNTAIGALQSTSTIGGAILASYAVTDNFFLAARAEYIGSTGNTTNLLYGPGSEAWSLTFTPTYQYKQFFIRPEISYVQAMGYTSGDVFGSTGTNPAQVRGLLEVGIFF